MNFLKGILHVGLGIAAWLVGMVVVGGGGVLVLNNHPVWLIVILAAFVVFCYAVSAFTK